MIRRILLLAAPFLIGIGVQAQPPLTNSRVKEIVSEVSESNIKAIVQMLVSFGTRHTLSDTISQTRGIGAARRWIKKEMERYAAESGGSMTVDFQKGIVTPRSRIPRPTTVVNVVATLKPRNVMSNRVIVVGGHYDSRASGANDAASDAPGANDDGSGTALTMELARIFARQKFDDVTMVFVAFAGEEQGLLGATQLAEMAAQKGWNIEAVLNNDIVGSSRGGDGSLRPAEVRVFSGSFSSADTGRDLQTKIALGLESDGVSRTLARYAKEVGERYVPGFAVNVIYRKDRFLRGGDHTPFHERGFPAVRFSVAVENYDWQHQNIRTENGREYGDLPKFMDFPYCANVTRINAAVLATLAFAPAPPAQPGIVVSNLEYRTTLRWASAKEPDLAGYLVRYRSTTSPAWEHTVYTRDTTLTLDVLKDDMLFGIQAVDSDGNASLPAIPRPVR